MLANAALLTGLVGTASPVVTLSGVTTTVAAQPLGSLLVQTPGVGLLPSIQPDGIVGTAVTPTILGTAPFNSVNVQPLGSAVSQVQAVGMLANFIGTNGRLVLVISDTGQTPAPGSTSGGLGAGDAGSQVPGNSTPGGSTASTTTTIRRFAGTVSY